MSSIPSSKSPKERFTDPEFRYYTRYMDLNKEMPKGKTEDGKHRCRWCWGPCSGRRTAYCSKECENEVIIRIGIGVRWQVRKRDKGVCAECGVDVVELRKALHGVLRKVPWRGRGRIYARFNLTRSEFGRTWWEADHILAVKDGGGGCGLSNYQTLCIWCHKEKSAAQKARPKCDEDFDPFK